MLTSSLIDFTLEGVMEPNLEDLRLSSHLSSLLGLVFGPEGGISSKL